MKASPPDPTPAELLTQIARALEAARDGLLQVSELLREELYEVDQAGRQQAASITRAAIERARTPTLPSA